ncbi:MAG: prepilin-type N-terminal cleavage/methylation domain-containing protein [Candidatus Omnitrophota bacterium]
MMGKKGFTLIELLVVIIIIGILASVMVPMMTANTKRAKLSEAVAGLGTIRTALRAGYVEHSAYNVNATGTMANGAAVNSLDLIGLNDLDGAYFDTTDYTLTTITASLYTVTVTKAGIGTATMTETGEIVQNYN